MHSPAIRKVRQIRGRNVIMRNAAASDAPFIFKIRATENSVLLNPTPTSNGLADQENYLREYENNSDHAYFIICDTTGMRKGTTSLPAATG